MISRYGRTTGNLLAWGVVIWGALTMMPAVRAAEPAKTTPGISAEAETAVTQMSKTLSASDFSFQARTIRVYLDDDGQPLHVFHTMKVVAHRPDRLAVQVTGDDGANDLFYDGKTVAIYGSSANKYARMAAPNKIEAMLEEVSDRLQVDFPLADLLDSDPGKSFLSGVTSGREVDIVTIEGKSYDHLFFSQTGGVELEIWLDKTGQALPRRLIITYRLLPGQPNFIAEFSDWNLSVHPADVEFVFQPPAGAKEVELKQSAGAPQRGGNK